MARASVGQFAKGADGLHINMYGRSFWKRLRPERSADRKIDDQRVAQAA
jgi:hypothetical protein